MKRKTGTILVAMALAGLVSGGMAYAFGGDGDCGQMRGKGGMGGMGGMDSQRMEQMMSRHLDKLHGDLKLSAEQESAWKSWSASVQEHMASRKDKRPDFAAMAKLPAPERAEKMLELQKARQQEMEASLPALRAFYAKLTPEQQQIFDRSGPFGHREARGDRRGGQVREARPERN